MKYTIKVLNKSIAFESDELSDIEVKSIESKINSELDELNKKGIISTLDQLITLVVHYAIERYILEKKEKTLKSKLSAKIDEINLVVRSSLDKDTLF